MSPPRRRHLPYRLSLTPRAQQLRRDQTPAERRLWFEFMRGLPWKFTRQKPLGSYVADFYCSSCRLVVEVDGDSHYDDAGQARDARRTAALQSMGLRVLRFTNLEVAQNFESVCSGILRAIEETA